MLTHCRPEPGNPNRVVMLGGSGFIGSALRTALERARIPILAPTSLELDLTTGAAGERLVEMLRTTDVLVFLAALTPDRGRGVSSFLKNISMGANVCAALEKITPAHVVYFSSDAVYPLEIGVVTEASCAQPSDLYGMMHLAREFMIKTSTDAPVAVLRPTLVYGANDTHDAYACNRFHRTARKNGRITLFGNGEEMRDHIAVEDVAALTFLVLRHRSTGTLNLATGCSVSYADLARRLAALFDKPIDLGSVPRKTPITHRHFDITALRRAFPTFVFTPLEEGLAKAHREALERSR